LAVFLVVHLGINLFILPITENHSEFFAEAAHFMGENPVIKVFEVVLMAAFLIHIIIGIIVQIENWIARGKGYKVLQKTKTPTGSRYMIYTGGVVLLFLGFHFIHFYFIKLGLTTAPVGASIPLPVEEHFYELAVYIFKNNMLYSILYIISFGFLGFHLNHAIQSAFQTLGFNHPSYTPTIKIISSVYAIIIAVGFASIPVYFMIAG
ncbi:MAG: succinate dehydrogenase cytochrome b subunit, partial [Bacteroidota bacterium]|nr:succinate dehydrogenase cytochrome b subunit [Bacteroidota bacterium]